MAELLIIESKMDCAIINADIVRSIDIDGDNDLDITFTDGGESYVKCGTKKEALTVMKSIHRLGSISNSESKAIDI